MPKLNLSADQVLTTTRAVRKRLDFERPVEMEIIKECLEIALQAPSGSNAQGWHFVVVTNSTKKQQIAELYQQSFAEYEAGPYQPTQLHTDSPEMQSTQVKVLDSARYLATNLARAPALLIPCFAGRLDQHDTPHHLVAGTYGSTLPAVWSFMLAARERGIGTCWTTLHLSFEREIARILGIPDDFSQVALTPIAYTKGTEFKPAPRKSLEGALHIDNW
ncbi:nitroreductase family protein [Biformimicrobium ophioploci]|uniref:Nitroreductase family protein n=1 Tax=Biformimicrobium ophioploci TaxID=3036711 RepID=A0ABQ6M288_9GAMM|nr:nitroreductase family protein [Microbulbifer sp. NKW57]GMG88399.1 nitroreductase family protein [Microbulbifer sp. NKW57]